MTIKIQKTCERCGASFLATKSGKPARFCSAACRMAWWRSRHQIVTITCDQCGKIVRRPPTGVSHAVKNHFCSQACKGKWMSQNLRGANHPNWKGDGVRGIINIIRKRLVSDQRWQAWAHSVLDNAHGLCERCGNPAEQAHHKREVAELLALIIDPANGEALCKNCHVQHHSQ